MSKRAIRTIAFVVGFLIGVLIVEFLVVGPAEAAGSCVSKTKAEFKALCAEAGGTYEYHEDDYDTENILFAWTKWGSGQKPGTNSCGYNKDSWPWDDEYSHTLVCRGKEPPCEGCECDDSCPPPPPQCDIGALIWEEDRFEIGWTTAIRSPAGSGCGNPSEFTGDPGTAVRLDVCIDGQGSPSVAPEMPFFWSEVFTVGPKSEVVVGDLEVLVSDPEFEDCERPFNYTWLGTIVSTTDTCDFGEPCWCRENPKDPRCVPTRCTAFADLQFNMVRGHVDFDVCYEGLSRADFQDIDIFDEVTICWRATGHRFLTINAVVQEPAAIAGKYEDIFNPSALHLTLDRPLKGYFEVRAWDDQNECGAYDRINFLIDNGLNQACVP